MAPPTRRPAGPHRPPSTGPMVGRNPPIRPPAAPPALKMKEMLRKDYRHPLEKVIKIVLFWTKGAGKPDYIKDYVAKAKGMLNEHDLDLDVFEPVNKVLNYIDAVQTDDQYAAVRRLAEKVIQAEPNAIGRLPVIVCPFVIVDPNRPVASFGHYGVTLIEPDGGPVTLEGQTWKPFVTINSLHATEAKVTLLHEIGHAAGLHHETENLDAFFGKNVAMNYLATQGIDLLKNFMNEDNHKDAFDMYAFQVRTIAGAYFAK